MVEGLDRGAVETWLVRMLRHARARGAALDWTFYCADPRPGAMEAEVRSLGAGIIHAPVSRAQKVAFMRHLRQAAKQGRYEVVHAHHDLVSALYLLAMAGLPIRRRLVHVHNADEEVLTDDPLKQRLYREPMRRVCLALADRIVGISNHTLDTFLAGRRRRPGRDLVHYYGVDPTPFETATADRPAFRRSLGLAGDGPIVLYAGRVVPEKNPLFAVEVMAQMHRTDPGVAGVFVGSGSLDAAVRDRAAELGLQPAFRQLGWRSDVAEIMSCCDMFILPRPEQPMEGLGLAVVEAQLAGLTLLLSRGIADDPLLPTARFQRLALAEGPRAWAAAAFELLAPPRPSPTAAWDALGRSAFDMDRALAGLVDLHR